MPRDSLFLLAVLGANVVLAELLARRTPLRHLGTTLIVILLTALEANLGFLPTGDAGSPVYDAIFAYVAPLGIFWLLLQVNLRDVLAAGLPMVGMFLLGSLGTFAGVLIGMRFVGGEALFGELHYALGGMFVGTYTGGSVNFNAVALAYDVAGEGLLYTGSVVVDNIYTTVWMVFTLALPRLLGRFRPRSAAEPVATVATAAADDPDVERVGPSDLGLLLALGAAAVFASEFLAARFAEAGVHVPPILLVTSLALVLAQTPAATRIRGARMLGMFAVYVFLAVVGAYCNLGALGEIGALGGQLMLFVGVVVGVHGLVVFGGAALLRVDRDIAAIASQANIGGGTTALALARSLGRADLALPAILVGSVGTGVGTYLGFLAARVLS